ncbi:DMT family transporter [Rhizobacter sp. Root1221]|uniref:DMT family transporter n=1 Tax=Rhizobacter sp. Root1221 TaxID=1736433 RepID=UPI0006FDC263|nr:DMT family transporter [Rhizobacter sp. Root1221]KQV96938.1 multidrug DMT transporter permease [Rhizobacter sp. Root1221]
MNTPSVAAGPKGALGTGGRSWPRLGRVEWLLLLVAVIWGGSYSAAKVATGEVPVLQFLVLRFGLTFLILLPALRGLAVASWPAALAGASVLGINLLAIFVCETFGVSLTTASNAAFLISLCVAFTPLCEWWLLKVRPSAAVLAAAGLSLLGAGLLAFQHGGSASLAWGDGLMVLAAFLRGVMVCMTRRHGQRHGLPALTVTAVQMGVMTLGSTVLMVAAHGTAWPPLPHSMSFWLAMAFLVLLCTLFAFFVQNYAASRTSPSRVALLMGSEPMWGALIAVLWMGEQMALQGWIGGLLIVASAWWVTRQEGQADKGGA